MAIVIIDNISAAKVYSPIFCFQRKQRPADIPAILRKTIPRLVSMQVVLICSFAQLRPALKVASRKRLPKT